MRMHRAPERRDGACGEGTPHATAAAGPSMPPSIKAVSAQHDLEQAAQPGEVRDARGGEDARHERRDDADEERILIQERREERWERWGR